MRTSTLKSALSRVAHAQPAKASIVEGIYFGGGKILATDLEQTAAVSGIDTMQRDCVLPGKIVDIVGSISSAEVDIEITDTYNCIITTGAGSFKIYGRAPGDYPADTGGDIISTSTIDAAELQDKLASVLFAASNDPARPAFSCVNINGDACASDTYRLAMTKLDFGEPVLLPAKKLAAVKLLAGDVTVNVSPYTVEFIAGDLTLGIRRANEKYPDITAVIPTQHKTKITVDSDQLSQTLNRAMLLAYTATLTVEDAAIIITASSEEGTMSEHIPCEVEGDKPAIRFNCKYLQDGLKYGGNELLLHGDTGPMILRSNGYTYLTLPVKVLI